MSSIRTRPTVQPTGAMMLNRITTITVKAAWPAANDTASGKYAATTTTKGSNTQRCQGVTPTTRMMPAPARNPTSVPPSARRAVEPVVNAVVRSTDIAASTTQKPCAISVTSASSTAMDSPSPPRTLFWNHTDRRVMCPAASRCAAAIGPSTDPGACRPSNRSSSGRASAAADTATVWPARWVV